MDKSKPKKITLNNEEKFRVALELASDGFFILNAVREQGAIKDFVWDYLNPAACRILRVKAQEVLGQKLSQTLPLVFGSSLFDDYVKVVESEEVLESEVQFRTKSASGWLRNAAVKLGDGVAVSLSEITERKKWEESLRQSELRFRVIFGSSMIGLFFWDEDGQILEANEEFLRMLGYRRQDFFLQSPSWQSLTAQEYRELVDKARQEVKENGSCKPFEKEIFRRDGRRLPVLLGAARLEAINYEGVAFVIDISERKEIEKEREILLGHELKTPLAGIKGFAQLLRERGEKKGDQSSISYLAKIEDKADWLTSLVNDLNDWSRIRAGKVEYRQEVLEFDQVVKEIVSEFQMGTSHQIKLEGKTGKQVIIDKVRLNQILVNLLTNAVKYSPKADRVAVKLGVKGEKVILSVRDFGIGISPEDKKRLFEPFFRSESSKSVAAGIGLGLHICSQIVNHYRGKIRVESEINQGSVFEVSLPYWKATL